MPNQIRSSPPNNLTLSQLATHWKLFAKYSVTIKISSRLVRGLVREGEIALSVSFDMSVESPRGQNPISENVQQTSTINNKQLPADSSARAALVTLPPSPQARRSEAHTPTPPGPSLGKKKTIPTPDASPLSIVLRGRSTKPRTPCEEPTRDPSQEARRFSSDNADNLARSTTPAAAPRAQAPSVCPRPSNPRIRNTLELIEQVRDSRYKRRLGEFYRERKLLPTEYEKLVKLIKGSKDEKLKTYFSDELKYEDHLSESCGSLVTGHLGANLISGTTILPLRRLSQSACPQTATKPYTNV